MKNSENPYGYVKKEKPCKVFIRFRVFDREQELEMEFPFEPMVYNIKRRLKLLSGSEKGHDENTTVFKEIMIERGEVMIIYKWVLTRWNNRAGKMRYRQAREEYNDHGQLMELIRTKQII